MVGYLAMKKLNWQNMTIDKKPAGNTVYNSLLVIAYLRKSSRTFYL